MGDEEAEAGPLADRLGGEERLVDPLEVLRSDAATRVHDVDPCPFPFGGSDDAQLSAPTVHGLKRVQHEVHEDLSEAGLVRPPRPQGPPPPPSKGRGVVGRARPPPPATRPTPRSSPPAVCGGSPGSAASLLRSAS